MPNDPAHVEIITGRERRRRYTANEKLSLVEATFHPPQAFHWLRQRNLGLLRPA